MTDEIPTITLKIVIKNEKWVTPFGTSAKIDTPKKYRGWRAYVIIVKD